MIFTVSIKSFTAKATVPTPATIAVIGIVAFVYFKKYRR